MMSISKQAYDVARKNVSEHGNRMKSRFTDFFTCEQYWLEQADSKCGGKDVQAWESSAIADSGENQSAFRLYARCGFILDCVPECSTLGSKAIQAFGRLVEYSAKNGFSWKNAGDKDAVKAFAADKGEKNQDAAKKEADRLQPQNKKSAAKRVESTANESPATISDTALASLLSLVDAKLIDSAMAIIAPARAAIILRACVTRLGEDEAVEIISPSATDDVPYVDVANIESQLQLA